MSDAQARPVRVLVHGASGRMGQAILRLLPEFPSLRASAAVSRHPIAQLEGAPWFAVEQLDEVPKFDVCIDFSLPQGFDRVLQLCLARRVALLSGTTGLSEAQAQRLEGASARIPVLHAANFSLGIAVLTDLVERAAAVLPGWQADVVESHHVHKLDAPSGTALVLGAAVERASGSAPHYASLRAGDIVGEHLVQLTGLGERLELVHRATDRDIFARGALLCAGRLAGREPGRYRPLALLQGNQGV